MTVICFRSVIQYSRNPIWPRLIFSILSCWCWLSHTMLMNSNNVWIWDVIQICKIFARIWQFSFFTLDVLGPKHELAPKQCKGKLVVWLVVLMIYVALAIFQPYRDLDAEINNLWIVAARPGIEPGPLAPQTKSLTTTPPLFLKGKHAFNVNCHCNRFLLAR